MKKQTSKLCIEKFSIIFFLSIFVFSILNSCEDNIEETAFAESFQVLSLNELPVAVQSRITTAENSLKSSVAFKNNMPFGSLIPTRVHQRDKSDGSVSYTLALSRESEALYYDNLKKKLPKGYCPKPIQREVARL